MYVPSKRASEHCKIITQGRKKKGKRVQRTMRLRYLSLVSERTCDPSLFSDRISDIFIANWQKHHLNLLLTKLFFQTTHQIPIAKSITRSIGTSAIVHHSLSKLNNNGIS
uniref:Uncharacterized protein n=1 Tax=Opuntia streptacantha TaxID=393608 RepID=A0A7C9DD41_OPUST